MFHRSQDMPLTGIQREAFLIVRVEYRLHLFRIWSVARGIEAVECPRSTLPWALLQIVGGDKLIIPFC